NPARVRSSAALGCAGTGPSWSASSQESTAPPSDVRCRVLETLSPLVTWRRTSTAASRRRSGGVQLLAELRPLDELAEARLDPKLAVVDGDPPAHAHRGPRPP